MDNHEKENALNIVTDERTYQVFAESPEDARCGGCRTAGSNDLYLNRFLYSSNFCVSVQWVV